MFSEKYRLENSAILHCIIYSVYTVYTICIGCMCVCVIKECIFIEEMEREITLKCSVYPLSGMIMGDYYDAFCTFQNLLIMYF